MNSKSPHMFNRFYVACFMMRNAQTQNILSFTVPLTLILHQFNTILRMASPPAMIQKMRRKELFSSFLVIKRWTNFLPSVITKIMEDSGVIKKGHLLKLSVRRLINWG